MNKLQKFITVILIIGLVLSFNFNLLLLKPKEAKAVVPTAETMSMQDLLKEVLDTIGHAITQTILITLEQKIMNWGLGRKSNANVPFAVTDWIQFFRDAVNIGAAKFISQYEGLFNLSSICDINLKNTLDSLGFNIYPKDLTYSQYAKPTLENTLSTLGLTCQEFIDSGYSIAKGGWSSWFALMEPQNNVFGQAMMAEQERYKQMMEEKEAADKETAVSSGVKNETATIATDIDACKEKCAAAGPPSPDCLRRCELLPGVVIQTQLKNWGSDINKLMTNALGADMQRLIGVDEITELLGVIISALSNKAMHGLGLAFNAVTSSNLERARAETKATYSYQRVFKKEQTAEDKKDVRSEILSNTLSSIQQLDRSIVSCEEDEMMTADDYAKNLSDIFSANVEALYIGLEGVNLKPDSEVLDPPYAPYSVYGYGWGNVPANKFPSKCKNITDQLSLGSKATCRSIHSGLEPNYNSRCEECMYDYDAMNCRPKSSDPVPPFTKKTNLSASLIQSKQNFYNSCRKWYLTGLNRCDECVKQVDEKCGQLNDEQKEQCIINNCNNYGDLAGHVVSSIQDGLDFYDKCLIEEKKEACYVCLKEYFVPADFCYQIEDYVARSIVKYPALVKMQKDALPWWVALGNWGPFGLLVNAIISDDKGMFVGPNDAGIMEMGGECNDNWDAQKISTALICRIMPDFKYQGEKVCKTKCNVSDEQLKDITDFSPSHTDCGKSQLEIGGHEPFGFIKAGVSRMRGKCCGALWQYDSGNYAICVGKGTLMEEEGGEGDVESTACKEGEVQLAYIKTTMGPKTNDCRRGCSSITFTVPNMENINKADVRTNAAPGGSEVVIAKAACTGGAALVGKAPAGAICRMETYNSMGSEACCEDNPAGRVRRVGKEYMICNLKSYVGQKLTLSVISDDPEDCKTTAYICVKE